LTTGLVEAHSGCVRPACLLLVVA